MPWTETSPMEERWQFVRDALSDRFKMSELCARYGVSRKIGYKWLARYDSEGRRGLADRSTAQAKIGPAHERRIRIDGASVARGGIPSTPLKSAVPALTPEFSCGRIR